MERLIRAIRRPAQRARRAEQFVQYVVAGGILLVAGLWIAALTGTWSPAWMVGVALALLGVGGLALGIWIEVDYPPASR